MELRLAAWMRSAGISAWACLSLAALVGVAGCANWDRDSTTNTASALIPVNRMAPDAVALEIGVAQLDRDQAETVSQFWQELDRQKLPLAVRKQLDRHGLQAAVMSSRPPSLLADLVHPREVVMDELNEFEKQLYIKRHLKPESRMVKHARISNRNGQSHPVPTSQIHPQLSWILEAGGRQRAGAGKLVRGVFSVTTFPLGDGTVRLLITPQVHHGQQKHRIGSAEHGFKFETRQSIERLDDLAIEVVLRAGESIVIGPTVESDKLGHLFFGQAGQDTEQSELAGLADAIGEDLTPNPADDGELPELDLDSAGGSIDDLGKTTDQELDKIDQMLAGQLLLGGEAKREKPKPLHRLLMIRVIQTQMDDLFSDAEVIEPLTSVDRY